MSDLFQSNISNVLSAPTVKASLVLKHGNAADWANTNPTLIKGELGIELDTGLLKVGDGKTVYTSLPYLNVTPAQFATLSNKIEGALIIQKPEVFAKNNIPIFDENGNLIDSGVSIGEYSDRLPASDSTLGMVLSSGDDNSISVDENGKMSLNRVSISNLYVPDGEELTFSAGNSN